MDKLTEKYFLILKDYFGTAFEYYCKKRPAQELPFLAEVYDGVQVDEIIDSLLSELGGLDWEKKSEEIAQLKGLKVSYLGSDVRPLVKDRLSTGWDFLKKTALYSDTVIMNESLFPTLVSAKLSDNSLVCFYPLVIKAFEWLSVQDLFQMDSDVAVCTLAPSILWQKTKLNLREYTRLEMNSVSEFASDVFETKISSEKEYNDFMSGIQSNADFFSKIHKASLVTAPDGTIISAKHLDNMRAAAKFRFLSKEHDPFSPYDFVISDQMTQIIDTINLNAKLKPCFSTDLKGIWNQFQWLLRHDNDKVFEALSQKSVSKDQLVLNALQQENLKWIGNVPIEKIKALRINGELEDMRELLAKNLSSLENATDDDFSEANQQVEYNLDQAFKKHKAQIKSLSERYNRLYKLSSASVIVTGAICIATAVYPPLAMATGVIGGGSIIESIREYLDLRKKSSELQKKPIAILFDAKNRT